MFVLLVVLFFVHWRSRVSSCGCCRRTTSGIRASKVLRGIFLAIRRASGADLVEIVCRSQISVGLVRGIMCRSQNSARSAQGIIGGVDLVRNSF